MTTTTTASLDLNSGVPLYQQLTQILRDSIMDGTFTVNSKIPTEYALGELYGVSRITVRNAIDKLATEGLIVKRQGKGTYVAPHQMMNQKSNPFSFTRTCENMGRHASTKVMRLEVLSAAPIYAKFFGLADSEHLIQIQRLRSVDSSPAMLETCIFPPDYDFLFRSPLDTSLYEILVNNGIKPCHYKKSISILPAGEEEQELLMVELGTPLLLANDYIYDAQYRAVQWRRQIIRTDIFHLQIET